MPAPTGPIESNGGGSILNVLSMLPWLTLPIVGAYSSAKAARCSMTNALRLELAPKDIRVSGRCCPRIPPGVSQLICTGAAAFEKVQS